MIDGAPTPNPSSELLFDSPKANDEFSLGRIIEGNRRLKEKHMSDRIEFLTALAEQTVENPIAMLNIMHSMAGGSASHTDIGEMLIGCSEGDMSLAVRKASELTDLSMRDQVILGLVRAMCNDDPNSALEILSTIPENCAKKLDAEIGKAIGKTATKVRIESLIDNSNASREFFVAAIIELSKKSTQEALDILTRRQVDLKRRFQLSEASAVESIAKHGDPSLIIESLSALPKTEIQRKTFANVMGRKLVSDPEIWSSIENTAGAQEYAAEAATQAVLVSPEKTELFLSRISSEISRKRAAAQATNSLLLKNGGLSNSNIDTAVRWAKGLQDPVVLDGVREQFRIKNVVLPKFLEYQ